MNYQDFTSSAPMNQGQHVVAPQVPVQAAGLQVDNLHYENIPAELRNLKRWLLAACDSPHPLLESVESAKAPLCIKDGNRRNVGCTNAAAWMTFDKACQLAKTYRCAIGFCLCAGDGIVCVDLDYKDATQEQMAQFRNILDRACQYTYCEASISGRGAHIWLRGEDAKGMRKGNGNAGIEVYSSARFMVCTGNVFPGSPSSLVEDSEFLAHMRVLAGGEKISDATSASSAHSAPVIPATPSPVADDAIKAVLFSHDGVRNPQTGEYMTADKTQTLMRGDWMVLGYPSQSEADSALLWCICGLTNDDAQVQRIFRESGLGQRDKAKRKDYLPRTIASIRAEMKTKAAQCAAIDGSIKNFLATALEQETEKNADIYARAKQAAERMRADKGNTSAPVSGERHDYFVDLPPAPGQTGELISFILGCVHEPNNAIATATAIGLQAGITGRRWNVSGTGLNQYIIVVAPTGAGKGGITSALEHIKYAMPKSVGFGNGAVHVDDALVSDVRILDKFVMNSTIASAPAFYRLFLDTAPYYSTCALLGEFGQELLRFAGKSQAENTLEKKGLFNELYEKSAKGARLGNRYRAKKEDSSKAIESPAFSFIGEATPETMHDALSTGLSVEDGLLSRLLIFETYSMMPSPNLHPVTKLADGLKSAIGEVVRLARDGKTGVSVDFDEAADDLQKQIRLEYRKMLMPLDTPPLLRALYNRAHLKIIKIAASMAVFDNPTKEGQKITTAHLQWAHEVVRRSIAQYESLCSGGTFDRGDLACEKTAWEKIQYFIKHPSSQKNYTRNLSDGIIPHELLRNSLKSLKQFREHPRGLRRAIDDAIQGVIESGNIQPITLDGKKFYALV